MKFILKPTDWNKIEADVLIVYTFEKQFSHILAKGREFSSFVQQSMERELFEGSANQILSLSTKGLISAYRLLIVGLGKQDEFNFYKLRVAVAKSFRKIKEFKPAKVAVVLPEQWYHKYAADTVVQAAVEAASLSLYQFTKYKSDEETKKQRAIEEVIVSVPASRISAAEQGLKLAQITSENTCFARDLINEPSVVTTPTFLAEIATSIAKESKGKVKVKILEREEAQKLGMGAYLGVSKGSDEPPKFIILSYKPERAKKRIVLVGKGITFDTGGLSLKPSEHMETMKMDMSGAATVLAVFRAFTQFPIDHQVVGIIPACENMPSGKALKPGDIVRTMIGKTIEVLNTDAEGRLTLADAFSYALSKEKPDYMIDLATLTGACMVALGQEVAGMWGNDESLLNALEKAADTTGEKIWRMPLESEYKDLIKSDIADVKNIQTGRYGGAITAALFLSEFVQDCKWVHFDIAGPAFEEGDTPLVPKGGAGFGVRLLLQFLINL